MIPEVEKTQKSDKLLLGIFMYIFSLANKLLSWLPFSTKVVEERQARQDKNKTSICFRRDLSSHSILGWQRLALRCCMLLLLYLHRTVGGGNF